MIKALRPYEKYKASGSPWLGQVPVTWEVHNLRTCAFRRNERNRPDLPLLSVAREKGVFVRSLTGDDENHNVIPEDLSNYKVARQGNLVINKMKAWQGSMGIAPCDGIVSPAYYVFDFKMKNRIFGQILLRSKPYVAHFAQASDGVRIGQWDLSISGMRQIPIIMPSENEQKAIVKFLNHTNNRIERAIQAKRKLIKLLQEQKQAIIHKAVTRGLDPNAPLKPSGIPWLGDIPKHWVIKPLKHWANINERTLSEKTSLEYEFNYLDIGSVGTGRLASEPVKLKFKNAPSRARRIVKAGDTIISTVRTYLKAVYFINTNAQDLIASTGFAVLTPQKNVLPSFLALCVQDSIFIDQVTANSVGIAYPAISETRLGCFCLAMPPSSIEQGKIFEYLEKEAKPFEVGINKANYEIGLLQEYRTRLVADVVTGKLDVREAAKHLPEELDSIEPQVDNTEELEEDAVEADA